jgi:hypothetical protein
MSERKPTAKQQQVLDDLCRHKDFWRAYEDAGLSFHRGNPGDFLLRLLDAGFVRLQPTAPPSRCVCDRANVQWDTETVCRGCGGPVPEGSWTAQREVTS